MSAIADPFESVRRVLESADRHLNTAGMLLTNFVESSPTEIYVDQSSPKAHVVYIRLTKPIPERLETELRHAVGDLRAALDQACYTCATSQREKSNQAHFPFSKTKSEFDALAKRGSRDVPEGVFRVCKWFKPWSEPDGNRLLCALNDVRKINEHRVALEVRPQIRHQIIDTKINFNSVLDKIGQPGYEPPFEEPVIHETPIWREERNALEIAKYDPRISTIELKYVKAFVSLGYRGIYNEYEFEHPLIFLTDLRYLVRTIVTAIEIEADRLELFSR